MLTILSLRRRITSPPEPKQTLFESDPESEDPHRPPEINGPCGLRELVDFSDVGSSEVWGSKLLHGLKLGALGPFSDIRLGWVCFVITVYSSHDGGSLQSNIRKLGSPAAPQQ